MSCSEATGSHCVRKPRAFRTVPPGRLTHCRNHCHYHGPKPAHALTHAWQAQRVARVVHCGRAWHRGRRRAGGAPLSHELGLKGCNRCKALQPSQTPWRAGWVRPDDASPLGARSGDAGLDPRCSHAGAIGAPVSGARRCESFAKSTSGFSGKHATPPSTHVNVSAKKANVAALCSCCCGSSLAVGLGTGVA